MLLDIWNIRTCVPIYLQNKRIWTNLTYLEEIVYGVIGERKFALIINVYALLLIWCAHAFHHKN